MTGERIGDYAKAVYSDEVQAMRREALRLADENGKIDAGPNTRAFLEEAALAGVVRRTGAMHMRSVPETHRDTAIGRLPVIGALWDQYELCDRGEVA